MLRRDLYKDSIPYLSAQCRHEGNCFWWWAQHMSLQSTSSVSRKQSPLWRTVQPSSVANIIIKSWGNRAQSAEVNILLPPPVWWIALRFCLSHFQFCIGMYELTYANVIQLCIFCPFFIFYFGSDMYVVSLTSSKHNTRFLKPRVRHKNIQREY